MGCGDQGVCKEDVSWRLGLSYRIHLETNWFLSFSDPPLECSSSLFCPSFLSRIFLCYCKRCHVSTQSSALMCFSSRLCVSLQVCWTDDSVHAGQHGCWQGPTCTMDSGLRVLLSTVLYLSQSLLISCSCKLLSHSQLNMDGSGEKSLWNVKGGHTKITNSAALSSFHAY